MKNTKSGLVVKQRLKQKEWSSCS